MIPSFYSNICQSYRLVAGSKDILSYFSLIYLLENLVVYFVRHSSTLSQFSATREANFVFSTVRQESEAIIRTAFSSPYISSSHVCYPFKFFDDIPIYLCAFRVISDVVLIVPETPKNMILFDLSGLSRSSEHRPNDSNLSLHYTRLKLLWKFEGLISLLILLFCK